MDQLYFKDVMVFKPKEKKKIMVYLYMRSRVTSMNKKQ